MSNRPEITIQHQTAFTDDGELEPTEESVETSLEGFGADVSHREVETRLDRPAASEFGVDDRAEVHRSEGDNSDQASLFADTAADQQTLSGDDASTQFLFDERETQTDERTTNNRLPDQSGAEDEDDDNGGETS